MWLHHDAEWWALVISIVALLLAFPLDVAAHLTSGVLKNWWASRSQATLAKRITKLERQLSEAQALPEVTATEDILLDGVEGILLLLGGLFAFGLTMILPLPPFPTIPWQHVNPLALIIALISMLLVLGLHTMIWKYHNPRSRKARDQLQKQINTLKTQLTRKLD